MTITTRQCYEIEGGTLAVVLTADHPLTGPERERLDVVAEACRAFQRRFAGEAESDMDAAIWAMGGEECICAG